MKVSMLDFANNNFGLGLPNADSASYSGPAPDLQRIVNAVASQGSILNLTETAPCSNCRCSLQFYGPAVGCNNLTGSLPTAVYNSARNATHDPKYYNSNAMYVAFVPYEGISREGSLPNANFTTAINLGVDATYQTTSNLWIEHRMTLPRYSSITEMERI
jgi:hypothetical protein